MKVNSVGFSRINYTSANTKQNTATKQEISEKQYNQAVAIGGLSVLGALGIIMLCAIKPKIIKAPKRNYTTPKIVIKDQTALPVYKGPNVYATNNNHETISSAWGNYIYNVEQRIKSHSKNYEKIFTDNKEELDKLEEVADNIISGKNPTK